MGEAKRRKKLLGKDYGKKPPVLIEGTPQFARHVYKFADAWTHKLEEIGRIDKLEAEEQKVKEEELDQWIREYLAIYAQGEREKIVRAILDSIYAQLAELPESETEALDFGVDWSLETISLYKMFKPYLSESSASEYAKPLISFYKIVIAQALEDSEADVEDLAAVEKLKQEFEEVLEIEESKRISHAPISVEPST